MPRPRTYRFPYPSSGDVLVKLIQLARDGILPDPIFKYHGTGPTISDLPGFTWGTGAEAWVALHWLGLIDDDGRHTSRLKSFRGANKDTLRAATLAVVLEVYGDLIAKVRVDASRAEIERVLREDFGVNALAIVKRMTAAFITLAVLAGLRENAEPRYSLRPAPNAGAAVLLGSVINELPRDGRWTWQQRNQWLDAFTATLDSVIEISGRV